MDSDFAGLWGFKDRQDSTSSKSHTGFVICVSNCPGIWSRKLQTDITLSTMEAEYNALLMVMKHLIPFHNCVDSVATSIGYNYTVQTQFQTVVWEDSNGTIVLAGQEPGHMTP